MQISLSIPKMRMIIAGNTANLLQMLIDLKFAQLAKPK